MSGHGTPSRMIFFIAAINTLSTMVAGMPLDEIDREFSAFLSAVERNPAATAAAKESVRAHVRLVRALKPFRRQVMAEGTRGSAHKEAAG